MYNIAADQQASGPKPAEIRGIAIGQFDIGPVMETLALCACASRQALPNLRGQVRSDILCGSGDGIGLGPGIERMLCADPKHISLADTISISPTPIDAVGGHPGKRHPCCQRPQGSGAGNCRFGGEAEFPRHIGFDAPVGIVRPGLRQIERPVNEGVPMLRDIGSKDPDLAIGDLARRAGILARNPQEA